MDLTRQPPRRPSNAQVAGIVGLARMIDKARGTTPRPSASSSMETTPASTSKYSNLSIWTPLSSPRPSMS